MGYVLPVCLGWRCVGLLACVRVCGWLPGLPGVCDLLSLGEIPGYPRPGSARHWCGLVELVPGGSSGGPAACAGCLVWPLMWAGAYSPGVDAVGHYGGALGLLSAVDRLPVSLGKHGNFTEKFPEKTPTKKFFKKFPPTGERSTPEIFLQKGLTYWLPYAIVKPRKSDRARRKPLRKEVRTWTK